jgi:hypothetical protein
LPGGWGGAGLSGTMKSRPCAAVEEGGHFHPDVSRFLLDDGSSPA